MPYGDTNNMWLFPDASGFTSGALTSTGDIGAGSGFLPQACYLHGLVIVATTAIAGGTTTPTLSVDYTDSDGSSNRTECLTLATGAVAVGARKATFIPPKLIPAGKYLITEIKANATGGGAAGVARCWLVLTPAGREAMASA